MVMVTVVMKVDSDNFSKLSKEEQLEFIKSHVGNYNEYDLAKFLLVEAVHSFEAA